jgi:hypothetical protein
VAYLTKPVLIFKKSLFTITIRRILFSFDVTRNAKTQLITV